MRPDRQEESRNLAELPGSVALPEVSEQTDHDSLREVTRSCCAVPRGRALGARQRRDRPLEAIDRPLQRAPHLRVFV